MKYLLLLTKSNRLEDQTNIFLSRMSDDQKHLARIIFWLRIVALLGISLLVISVLLALGYLPQAKHFFVYPLNKSSSRHNSKSESNIEPPDNSNVNIHYSNKILPLSMILDDKLYLGSISEVSSYVTLKQNNINIIMNMAREVPIFYPNEFIYHHYLWDDLIKHSGTVDFAITNQIIDDAINNDKRVLVHCFQGVNRSVSVIVAYLMWKNNWTFDQSIKYVRSIRPIARPNRHFQFLLQEYELKLNSTPVKSHIEL